MKHLARRLLLEIRLRLTKAFFLPLFLYIDARNRLLVRLKGEVLSVQELKRETGGTFCVFLLYPFGPFSGSVRRALRVLADLNVNIVAVCNRAPLPADQALLEALAHTVILRRNVGRDFGGYRTGILHVLRKLKPERIMIANDSVYYLENGLREYFAELCGPHEFVGAAENHEFGYHVGSYALGFGPRVINDRRFRTYWQRYRLSELRPRVIKHGEIALNRLIIRKLGIVPHVIYSPARLAAALATTEIEELIATAGMMPGPYQESSALDRLRSKVVEWFKASPRRGPDEPSRTVLAAASIAHIEPPEILALIKTDYRSALERSLLDFVFRGSQIHWGSALLIKYLSCPIIKTDLIIRSIYGPGELSRFNSLIPADQFDEFYAISTRRGNPVQHWTLLQRMLLSIGYI